MAGEIKFRLDQIKKDLTGQNLAREAHRVFVKETPIRTGNARKRTRLQNQTIAADYPYAQRLDNGYSDQAPEGMTKPTIEHMRKFIQRKTK
jgi:hypothetical protein